MNTKERTSYTSVLHTDFKLPNVKTSLLYLNTCNGGTVVADQGKEKYIKSEENKIIIFPCKTLHRGVGQTDVIRRAVININYA
jgi:succinylglutamate desuccinylase